MRKSAATMRIPGYTTPRALSAIAIAAVAIAGCGGDDRSGEPPLVPMPATLIGTYTGEFPCSNCATIDAALWLRADHRFVLRQRYVDESGAVEGPNAYSLGRWTWDEARAELVLIGAGRARRLVTTDADGLELRTATVLPHVLERDPTLPPFTDSIPLTGVAVVTGNVATFRECLSQLELDVAPDGAFPELRRQHRSFSARGRPALTDIDGHLRQVALGTRTREIWVLDRVLSVKPDRDC